MLVGMILRLARCRTLCHVFTVSRTWEIKNHFDFKKEYKAFYLPPVKPVILDVLETY